MPLQQTSYGGNDPREYVRADLIRDEFESLIYEKGRDVLIEQALMCPCKSPASNQQSTCKNCGGTGWAFVNARQTRMVLTGVDAVSKNFGWSEEVRGMMNVSCAASEEITYMDRITLLSGIALYQEVLFVKNYGTTYFTYSAYKIKSIIYIAMFSTTSAQYVRLTEGTDYTFSGNAITFISNRTKAVDIAITIRYRHAPTYHVVEMKRETMESFRMTERGEKLQHMPLSAYARRAHYILDAQNLAGDRMLNNDYPVDNCSVQTECSS